MSELKLKHFTTPQGVTVNEARQTIGVGLQEAHMMGIYYANEWLKKAQIANEDPLIIAAHQKIFDTAVKNYKNLFCEGSFLERQLMGDQQEAQDELEKQLLGGEENKKEEE